MADTTPLAGIRVLDLSRVLAGPWATQLLADLGAEVIKVERPDSGDDTRGWGPPWFIRADGSREAAYFTCANRGKRSIAIDLATPAGADHVRAIAAESDVLVENFKVGDLARHGLDQPTLARLNPRLIYCSVSGFGQDGPAAKRPGYDFIIQAMAGLMSVTGEAAGAPMKAGVAITDILTGLYAANGIQAALLRRERTGMGGHVDVALFDVQLAAMANQAANYLASGRDPARHGNAHPNIVPYQAFACADGVIAIATGNDRQYRTLCDLLGRPDLAGDPAYATNADRVANREALIRSLEDAIRQRPRDDWLGALAAAGIPAGPVNGLAEAFAEPVVAARGLVRSDPDDPALRTVACPIRLDGVAAQAAGGVPALDRDGPALRAARPERPLNDR